MRLVSYNIDILEGLFRCEKEISAKDMRICKEDVLYLGIYLKNYI